MNDRPSPTTAAPSELPLVFQPTRDELLEELAMSGRVLRVAASALLRVDARSAQRRQKRALIATERAPRPPAPAKALKPAKPEKPAKAEKAPVAKAPAAKAPPAPAQAAPKRQPATRQTPAATVSSDRILKARSRHHAKLVAAQPDPAQAAADEELWESYWASADDGDDDRDPLAELNSEQKHPGRVKMRGRVHSALNSWADSEVSVAMRLERALGSKRTPPVG